MRKRFTQFLIEYNKRKKWLVNLTKKQSMKGKTPLFAVSDDHVRSFWQNRDKNIIESKYKNAPKKTQFLYEQISSLSISKNDPILEIGCNMGRNLAFLYEKGFHNLVGIEIGISAVELMKETYPDMYSKSRILLGSVEEKIKEIGNNQITLTFTNEVLQHIHPSSNFIFSEISRVTSRFIVLREREGLYSPSSEFPRDYGKIFTNLGWKQIKHRLITEDLENDIPNDYILRIFEKLS